KDDKYISYFDSRHKAVQDQWKRSNDFVVRSFLIDKMDYSKNCAPFSIYPFDIETCTDIMMGRRMIFVIFNFTEFLRLLERSGWKIVDAILFKTEDELNVLKDKEIKDISFLKIRKGPLTFDMPPSLLARIQFELLSPITVIEHCEEVYRMGPQKELDYLLTNFTDEQRIWN
ncbi:MAG TPA: hypothetical protein VMT12_03200, partial [Syntrophales bacterium]|nr:hypothetical protein [Syntrophales bacterium]